MPVRSVAALQMNSVICDDTLLAKVSCHTLLLAVPVGKGALMAAAIGALASVCVLSLPAGTVNRR